MEEKRPGQRPEAEQQSSADATQARTQPLSGAAEADGDDAAQDRALIEEAAKNAEASNEAMRERGFGDHQGTVDFRG